MSYVINGLKWYFIEMKISFKYNNLTLLSLKIFVRNTAYFNN